MVWQTKQKKSDSFFCLSNGRKVPGKRSNLGKVLGKCSRKVPKISRKVPRKEKSQEIIPRLSPGFSISRNIYIIYISGSYKIPDLVPELFPGKFLCANIYELS